MYGDTPIAGMGFLPAITAATTAASSGGAASTGVIAGAAGGPIGLAIGGAITGLMLLFGRKGPKQKLAATDIVNAAATFFQTNDADFFAGRISKQEALSRFEQVANEAFNQLAQLGDPGHRAIEERKPGGKYDWWKDHYDPIATAATATPNPLQSVMAGNVSSPSPLIMIAGLAVVAYALMSN